MVHLNGAQALIRSMKDYGINTVFGLPGVQLDHLFDALYQERDSIRVIHTRHEQAAAFMAFGYAQSTGKVGTCIVVPGPGLLNAGAALSTAYACNAPVLCLTGQIPSKYIGKNTGQLHEVDDQLGAMASVVKWSKRIEHPFQTPEIMKQAFIHLNSGRRRPVLLEVAPDILAAEENIDLIDTIGDFSVYDPDPDPDLIAEAASALCNANNPGIFVGGGIYGAERELLALAEQIQAPVFMSENGLGAVDQRHYLGHNLVSAYDMWSTLDVVLAVGTRFSIPLYKWQIRDDVQFLRIDIDPHPPLDSRGPDVEIASTAVKALRELSKQVSSRITKKDSREAELNQVKMGADKKAAEIKPVYEFCQAIRSALPKGGIICFDVCQMLPYAWFGFPMYKPRTMLQPGYQGTLGYAFSTALGAKIAHPGRKVVAVTGDGGFMFSVQELATAKQHNINLVTIILNDATYGLVKDGQREYFGGRYIACDLQNPDFMKLADAFNVPGFQARTPKELQKGLHQAFKEDSPTIIEVPIKEWPSPRQYVPF